MGNPNVHTISDPRAIRVCNLAGISAADEELIKLSQLRDGITVSLRDLEAERKRDAFLDKAFLVLRFTKATCDAFIGLAAELSVVVPGAHQAAQRVKSGYELAKVGGETGAKVVTGAKVDYAKSATTAIKSASEFVPGDVTRYLIKNGAIKTDIFVGAINGDRESVKKSAVEYMSELSKFTLESLKQEDASSFLGVAKETFEYHETLNDTFDEYLSSSEDATVRYINAKANFTRLATRLQKKIHELEEFLESCSDAVPNS